MNLTVDRREAALALARVGSVVMRRTTIPILSHVALHANGALSICGTDLDRQVVVSIPYEGSGEAETAAPMSALHDALQLSVGETADLAISAKRLGLTVGAASFKLPTLPAADFPLMKDDDLTPWGEIEAAELRALIDATIHAASRDAAKFYANGLRFMTEGSTFRLVALDGFQLAIDEREADLNIDEPVTIPLASIAPLKSLISSGGPLKISGSARLVKFVGDGLEFTTKVIDAAFPDYRRPFKFEVAATFTVDSAALSGAARRALVVAQDKERSLSFELRPQELSIATSHASAESAETVPIVFDGEKRSFGLPADKLLDALDALDAETVEIGMTAFSMNLKPAGAPMPRCLISLFRTN